MRSALLILLLCAAGTRAEDASERMARETLEHTKALIALDTSNPPGNEILAARYLKKRLDREGIESGIYVSEGTRASLIARLRGSGEKRPLLLMCHTDVVPADRKNWTTPPFTAVEKDGFLYGRGSGDIKSMCAAQLAVMLRLKREKAALARDVIFFAEADEEGEKTPRHIDWLMANHADKLAAEIAINEGGNSVWRDGRLAEVLVEAAGKEYVDVHLTARGSSGHSSVPRKDNAVAALAEAVRRLSALRFPAEMNPVTRSFFRYKASSSSGALKDALERALAARPGRELDAAAARLSELAPELGAMLTDTLTPTVLQAGYKNNVIPSEAKANLNARLLPGHTVPGLLERLRSELKGLPVSVEHTFSGRPPVGAMPADGEVVRAARAAAAELFPGTPVVPFMAAWTTDSQDLRARGTLVYGIDPAIAEGDLERLHGDDERVPLAALDAYARYLWRITELLAARTDPLARGQ